MLKSSEVNRWQEKRPIGILGAWVAICRRGGRRGCVERLRVAHGQRSDIPADHPRLSE